MQKILERPRSISEAGNASVSGPARPGLGLDLLWLALCLTLSSLWCLTAARQIGATFDEPVYVQRGLERWRSGSLAYLMKLGTMPLPVDVQTLPLYLWERSRGVEFDTTAEFHTLLPYARAATLVFWWFLLVHVWLIGRSLGGAWAGRLAVGLAACEPSLLAHAGLATTDIAVTAMLLALCWHFHAQRQSKWWRRVAWPGLWFGLATLAKASGLVFGSLCLLVIEGQRTRWWREGTRFRDSFRDLVQIGLIGLAVTFVYCGSDWRPQASFVKWARGLPPGPGRESAVWLAENLRIFSNAGEGIARQVTHNVRGHGSYLLGQVHPRAIWYYFPVVTSAKVTLTLLALAGLSLLLRRGNWAVSCALALLAFSLTCRVQIGVRFMFPLIALAIAGLSAAVVRAAENWSPGARAGMAGLLLAGLSWSVFSAARHWPDGLCFVNEAWGGSEQGYRVVSEANYDWGQGIAALRRWREATPGTPLTLLYFGADPAVTALGARSIDLHDTGVTNLDRAQAQVRGTFLAVSTTVAHGPLQAPALPHYQALIRQRRPIARVSTFFIYDFTSERQEEK